MKELIALLAFVLVVGVGGFLYRNALERPLVGGGGGVSPCASDAQICPDGTAIARSGAACAFAPCPFPNVEIGDIALVVPSGFVAVTAATTDPAVVGVFDAAALSGAAGGRIEVRHYAVPAGASANETVLATAQSVEGALPESMLAFTPIIVNGATFEVIDLGTPEAPRTGYYLLRESSVLRIDAIEPPAGEGAERAQGQPVREAVLKMLGTASIQPR
jgi:hypothetical protein